MRCNDILSAIDRLPPPERDRVEDIISAQRARRLRGRHVARRNAKLHEYLVTHQLPTATLQNWRDILARFSSAYFDLARRIGARGLRDSYVTWLAARSMERAA